MKKGFTIIEVTLVMSVASLLAAGLMIGWSANIDRQQYQDAVSTLQSDIQGIFNEVENPGGVRRSSCVAGDRGVVLNPRPDGAGTSDCIVIGKMIVLGNGDTGAGGSQVSQSRISVFNVVGRDVDLRSDCRGGCSTHVDALRASRVSIEGADEKQIDVQWGYTYLNITDNRNSRIFRSSRGVTGGITNSATSFFIVRSPLDGSVLAFANPGRDFTTGPSSRFALDSIFDAGLMMNDSRKINICVQGSSANRVIRIGSTAASVEIAPVNGAGGLTC